MELTPRDVTYFLAVAQHKRLAKAAEACRVTQPALTKAIQRIEAQCGLTLFERDARGTRLTADGERFKETAEALARSYEEAMRVAANVRAQQSGLLRLGSTDATRSSFVPAALATLLRQRPGLRATLRIGQSDQLARAVVEGRLDAAVIPTYGPAPEGCDHVKLGEDPHLPVMSERHPLAARSRVEPADLAPHHWIHTAPGKAGYLSLAAIFARFELPPPTVTVEIEYVSEAVLSLVRNSELLAMVPRSFFRATDQFGLRLVPVAGLQIDRSVLCITRAGMERSPLTDAFRDLLMMQADARRSHDSRSSEDE